MASAAPSSLASSVEKTNGAKLSRLLIDGGTTVLRSIFDGYHPPASLSAAFAANYLTLNNLLRRRALHRPQWDLLFPPSGAPPDSQTFDITLLFLLLTNICGLFPPRSGWHTKPPPGDISVEANLARIKFYRNKLYGHVSTTGIVTPSFSALWQEISVVLVRLGLQQAEIDRLKAERCGEEDYIDALLEWADSEEDIKSQLRDMRDVQTKVQQIVGDVRQTQQEDHEAIEEGKAKLEEVHQLQTNLQQTVGDVRQTQLEDHEAIQEGKTKLEEVHQLQTNLQQTVGDVRQTQLEDHEAIQEGKTKLEEVHQLQTNLQQTVGDVRQTQLEDHEAIQEGKAKLEEVHQLQTNLQQTVGDLRQTQVEGREILQENKGKLEDVYQTQVENHQTLQDSQAKLEEARRTQLEDSSAIQDTRSKVDEVCERLQTLKEEFKQNIEDLKSEKERLSRDEILRKLAKIDTSNDVRHHAARYVEGTRLSIFAKVDKWLYDETSPNRVMVISGNAGMGKSVIAAVLCKKMVRAGRLLGSHFCQHNKARRRNPKVMLQSLACQLSDCLPEYKKALLNKLSTNLGEEIDNMEVRDLFELLFEEPLQGLSDPGLTYLMVIDGLDESEYQGRNELLDVIANYFNCLPRWFRFVVTTRPEINITDSLRCLQPVQLEPANEENLSDIHIFFKEQLNHVLQKEVQEKLLKGLVQKSEGVMLYAHYLVGLIKDLVKKRGVLLTGELMDSTLPSGISSVYQSYFERLEIDLRKQLKVTEDQFFNFLCAIAAAREPLPIGFVSKLLLSDTWSSAGHRKVMHAIACISTLLPIEDDCIHFFHKSIKDWLIERSSYGLHKFSVDKTECHRILAKLCTDEFDGIKVEDMQNAQFGDTTKYALQYGVQHILEVDEDTRACSLEEVVKKYVLDLELVYAKLCVKSTSPIEDVLFVQESQGIKTLFGEYQRALETLLFLLKKHIRKLTELPLAIFQTLLNEGGSEMSSEALSLLNTKYSDIPYMEYLEKKDPQAAVQMRFYGSDQIACFDVSPKLDYLVCECKDGTLHLWSLRTAKKMWKRAVRLPDIYRDTAYRVYRGRLSPRTLALYRSVVFHPTLNLILPGILSQAYTIAGDLKPLFVTSKCRFEICSISGDKTTILTDCLENKRCIIQWSLKDGTEIARFTHKEEILSFAWSPDGRLIAISDSAGCISLVDAVDGFKTLVQKFTSLECGMLKITPDCQFIFGLHLYRICIDHIFSLEGKLLCLDVKRDTVARYNFVHFPEKHSHYSREFESCNECGFLSGDPFWYPLETRFNYRLSGEFALVLNKQFLLTASRCSNVIEMFSLDDLLVQGTELGGLSEQTVESDDLPEQGVELDDLPEQGVELDDLPEQGVELDDLPEQGVELDDLPEQGAELDDLPEQGVGLDDLTEQRAVHAYLEEQSAELHHAPKKRAKVDYLPEQGDQLGDQSELRVELDDLSEQGPAAFDDLLEGRASLYNLSELDDSDDLEHRGALLEDLEEKRVDEVCDLTIESTVHNVVFSVNGDALYVVRGSTIQRINLMTWDISSKKYNCDRYVGFLENFSPLPVKRGVLFQRNSFSLELWNSELSECIQSWTDFHFDKVAPISEERVALETWNSSEGKHVVLILDTTSGDIVSTIGKFDGEYLAYNSKCEVLTRINRNSLQLRRDDIVLWVNSLPSDLRFIGTMLVVFSPTDRFFVISGTSKHFDKFVSKLYVFDAVSGRALHMLWSLKHMLFVSWPICKFVSDDECVVRFHDKSRGAYLRLYNAKSGELLSEIVEERKVSCLAASPIKRLVAISFYDSKKNFEIIQVKLPGDKERRNNKRLELQE